MNDLRAGLVALGRLGLGVTVVVALVGAAAAEPLGDDVRALVERELSAHVSARELTRLLRDRDVRSALGDLFEGWDGVGDELLVTREGGHLVLQTLIRQRRCLTHIRLGAEAPEPDTPTCFDVLGNGGDRRLVIDERILEPPRPALEPKQAVAAVTAPPPEEDDGVRGPVENTVLRRPDSLAAVDMTAPVMRARVAHDALKQKLRGPHWKDPLLPEDPVEAGQALRPLELPAPVVEARVESNLRNPFDVSRLRTQDPVPYRLTLPPADQGPSLLPPMREECAAEWRLRTRTPEPPTLDCYRRVSWHDRLEDDDAYQALSRISSVLQLPLLDTAVAILVKSAVSHRAHRVVWAFVWTAWVKEHPDRAGEALSALTPEERRLLRRRLAEWWVEPELAELRPMITRLFERHLLGLYPEATDLFGLPRRAFVTDTWLWANNWLAINDDRAPEAISAAFQRLSAKERRVIDAFARDRDLAPRWAKAAAVIARH